MEVKSKEGLRCSDWTLRGKPIVYSNKKRKEWAISRTYVLILFVLVSNRLGSVIPFRKI